MAKLDHICIDLETLSTRSNATIVTIAAAKFSLKSEELETFCVNINPKSFREYGTHIDPETIEWWKKKPEAAKAWQHSQVELPDALDKFLAWSGNDKYTRWHCNGANFDFPILDWSLIATGKKAPWQYWMLTDMRTAYYLGNLNTFNEPRVGTYHNALDDVLTQIKWLKKALGIVL